MFHVQLPQLPARWTLQPNIESLSEKAEDLSISTYLMKCGKQRAFNRRTKCAALTVLAEHRAGSHTAAGFAPGMGLPAQLLPPLLAQCHA